MPEQKNRFFPDDILSQISLLAAFLAFVLALFYRYSDHVEETLQYQVAAVGILLLVPYFLSRYGYVYVGGILMSFLLPVLVLVISLYNKQTSIDIKIINPVNYFDTRFVLLSSILVPMTVIPIRKLRLLIIALCPSFLSLAIYDPLHDYFGVGYYDVGMQGVDYYYSANIFSFITYFFLAFAFLFLKNKLERSETEQHKRRVNLSKYMEELVGMSNSMSVLGGAIDTTYDEAVGRIQRSVKITRVSIWEFTDNYDSIVCKSLNQNGELNNDEIIIHRKDNEQYFNEILTNRIIIADQAQKHPSTRTFSDTYLAPLDIRSMMDVSYLSQGKVAGIICCEHQHKLRKWVLEDSIFLKAMADTISYAFANREQVIKNEELESRVRERTVELEEKNKQLQEYAYINAHILRAPVARVAGLYSLIEREYGEAINSQILNHFKVSVEELDVVTYKIKEAISELGTFNRENIKIR